MHPSRIPSEPGQVFRRFNLKVGTLAIHKDFRNPEEIRMG